MESKHPRSSWRIYYGAIYESRAHSHDAFGITGCRLPFRRDVQTQGFLLRQNMAQFRYAQPGVNARPCLSSASPFRPPERGQRHPSELPQASFPCQANNVQISHLFRLGPSTAQNVGRNGTDFSAWGRAVSHCAKTRRRIALEVTFPWPDGCWGKSGAGTSLSPRSEDSSGDLPLRVAAEAEHAQLSYEAPKALSRRTVLRDLPSRITAARIRCLRESVKFLINAAG